MDPERAIQILSEHFEFLKSNRNTKQWSLKRFADAVNTLIDLNNDYKEAITDLEIMNMTHVREQQDLLFRLHAILYIYGVAPIEYTTLLNGNKSSLQALVDQIANDTYSEIIEEGGDTYLATFKKPCFWVGTLHRSNRPKFVDAIKI